MKKHLLAFSVIISLAASAAVGQSHFEKRMVEIKAEVAALPPETTGTIAMVGDSITEGFFKVDVMPKEIHGLRVVNHGIGGDQIGTTTSTIGVMSRLDEITKSKPAVIFLMIGINNMWDRSVQADTLIGYYETLLPALQKAAPDAKIVVQSVLPTRDDNSYTNKNVFIINWHLEKMAAKNGAEWLDLTPIMSDDQNLLKAEFTGDAVHLKPEAYKLWLEQIEAKSAELLKK